MSWFKRWWKRLFCLHDYQYDRTLYGDETNHYKYRNIYRCALCGKEYNIDYLQDEKHFVTFPFPDSYAVVGGRAIWCGSITRFSECRGFIPGPPNTSETDNLKNNPTLCGNLDPETGKCLKYKRG